MNDIAAGPAAFPDDGTMAAWLTPILTARGTTLDAAQTAARDRLQAKREKLLAEDFPNVVARVYPLELSPPAGWPLQ